MPREEGSLKFRSSGILTKGRKTMFVCNQEENLNRKGSVRNNTDTKHDNNFKMETVLLRISFFLHINNCISFQVLSLYYLLLIWLQVPNYCYKVWFVIS